MRLSLKCFLILTVLANLSLNPLLADDSPIAEISDSPEFSSEGQSIWSPEANDAFIKSFRQQVINIDEAGEFGDFVGIKLATAVAEFEGPLQFLCPADSFIDVSTGNCFSCPEGFQQNPALPADVEGVCFRLSNFTVADDVGDTQFLCPAGEFPDLVTGKCFSCPSGTSQDPLIPAQLPGACKANRIASRQSERVAFCEGGTFPDASLSACYSCDSGFDHNPLLSVNTKGVCSRTRFEQECGTVLGVEVCSPPFPVTTNRRANKEYDLGCDSGDFSGGVIEPNRCYSCSSGFSHNPILPVNVAGVCFANESANEQGDVTLICGEEEFLDLASNRCFACPSGYTHNPALPADVPGVCFRQTNVVAEESGDQGLFCPSGQFVASNLDQGSTSCYSCDEDFSWNPAVPITEDGSCTNWSSLEVTTGLEDPDAEAGVKVDYSIEHREGITGEFRADPGSVDIGYKTDVLTQVFPIETDDGLEHYRVQTIALDNDNADLDMEIFWPGTRVQLDYFQDMDYQASGEIRYPQFDETTFSWSTGSEEAIIFDADTGGEVALDPDHPILEITTSPQGGSETLIVGREIGELFDYDGGYDPPLVIPNNFFTDAANPISILKLGTPILELGFSPGELNLPPNQEPSLIDDVLDRDAFLDADFFDELTFGNDASIEQLLMAAPREGFRFATVGAQQQEVDLLRLDLDLDGVLATAATGGAIAAGYQLTVASPIPFVNYYKANISAFDADLAMIFNIKERFEFEPRLQVITDFSQPVLVRTDSNQEFAIQQSVTVDAGEDFEFIHPGGDLQLSNRYSLQNNQFNNDLDLLLTGFFEFELLSFEQKILLLGNIFPKLSAVQYSTPEATLKVADLNFVDTPLEFDDWLLEENPEIPALVTELQEIIFQDGFEKFKEGLGLIPNTISFGEWRATIALPLPDEISLLEELYLQIEYDGYRREVLDVASWTIDGFEDQTGQFIQIRGLNNQPVARCKNGNLEFDVNGQASLALSDIDNGSSDFDGAALANLILSQTDFSCQDAGLNTVQLTVTDFAAATNQCSAQVAVTDTIAPTISAPDQIDLLEGEVPNFESVQITENCDRLEYSWTFPDGFVSEIPEPVHPLCKLGSGEIKLELDDGFGGTATATIDVDVSNRAPGVDAGADLEGLEGQEIMLQGANFVDFGLPGHTVSINWGDDAGFEPLTFSDPEVSDCGISASIAGQHTYLQDGEYVITLRVMDEAGATSEDATTVKIRNANPSITNFSVSATELTSDGISDSFTVLTGSSVTVELEYTDPGVRDEHEIEVYWQAVEPTSSELGVISSSEPNVASQTAEVFKPGSYIVIVQLIDEAGGVAEQRIPMEVIPLNISLDFIPLNDNNDIDTDQANEIYELIIFSGRNQLGNYFVEDIITRSIVLGSNESTPQRSTIDVFGLFSFLGNVVAEYQDINGDGLTDVKVQFDAQELNLDEESRSLETTGQFTNERWFAANIVLNKTQARADFLKMSNALYLLLLEDVDD